MVAESQDQSFYDELDQAHPNRSRSCCTLWTLALGLLAILSVALWVVL